MLHRLPNLFQHSPVAIVESCLKDAQFGLRQLIKSPVLLMVAVFSLALGIGANTAIFSLIKVVMLQRLPVRDPASLLLLSDNVSEGTSSGDLMADALSYPAYRDLATHNDSFQGLCAFREGDDQVSLHVPGQPGSGTETATVHLVSGNYFDVLGVNAAAGRLFRDTDDAASSPPAAVMSYGFWESRFHRDPSILNKTLVLNGTSFTIAGVAQPGFIGERIQRVTDLWVPLSFQPQIMTRERPFLEALDTYWLNCMGRLKPGVTRRAAQQATTARLHAFYLAQAGAHPSADARRKIESVQLKWTAGGGGISWLRSNYSKPLSVLMGVVAVVLLIACANVATLLLARASARQQEFSCRLALGASRTRLFRQVLTESILLALMGGAAGVAFAWWSAKGLVLLVHLDPLVTVRPDRSVLLFTLAVSIGTGILFGFVPAWRWSRIDLRPGSSAPRHASMRRFGSLQSLVIAQIALALPLLVAAGLLAHSLVALETQDLGFQSSQVLLARTDAGLAGYQPSEYPALYQTLMDRISQLPGVQSAALARFSPFSGYSSSGNFSLQGYRPTPGKDLRVWDLSASPGFFETLKIPVLLGRTINERDTAASGPVIIVNQTFVDEYLRGRNPIGQRMAHGYPFEPPGWEIVGVVSDSKFFDIREKAVPMVFHPIAQEPVDEFEVLVRTAADPGSMAAEVRRALKQVNQRLPMFEQHQLNDQIDRALREQKMIATLTSIFGVVGLVLALIGIYGTLSYAVTGRTREIGLRMAIGARRGQVIALILRELVSVMVFGLLAGLLLALGATRSLGSFLFGVKPLDPLALGAALLLIGLLGGLAAYLPAARAARIDPMLALRNE